MGSMKEKNRRKWWSSGRRGDRSEHGSEIRRRYADPPHGESIRAMWRSYRGNDGSRTDCGGGGWLRRRRMRANDRESICQRPSGRENRCTGDGEESRSYPPILRGSERVSPKFSFV